MKCIQCERAAFYKNGLCRSCAKLSHNNPMWKGDNVGYSKLHDWVKSRLPKLDKCQNCKQAPAYDLANKGVYNRELKNWKWLCRKCHMLEDGRLSKFLSHRRPMPKGNKYYLNVKNRPRGESNTNSKLQESDVIKIRAEYANGTHTQQKLARMYNVTFQNISRIINHQTWTHI